MALVCYRLGIDACWGASYPLIPSVLAVLKFLLSTNKELYEIRLDPDLESLSVACMAAMFVCSSVIVDVELNLALILPPIKVHTDALREPRL